MSARLHNLALAQRASHAVRELGNRLDDRREYPPRAPRHAADDLLTAALDALTPDDLAHLAAHSLSVAEWAS